MSLLIKNQVKTIWKKWLSFFGVFWLLVLSATLCGGATSTSNNIKGVLDSLTASNIFKYYFSFSKGNDQFYSLSDLALTEIKDYYFNDTYKFSVAELSAIDNVNPITVFHHQSEINAWNYNFRSWFFNRELSNYYGANKYQLSITDSMDTQNIKLNNKQYKATLEGGFDDPVWNAFASKQKRISDTIYIQSGHKPTNNNEVVVSPTPGFSDFKVNSTITINNHGYKIVGIGYSYNWYRSISYNGVSNLDIFLNNSEFNGYWINEKPTVFNRRFYLYNINVNDVNFENFNSYFNQKFLKDTDASSYIPLNNWDFYNNFMGFKIAKLQTLIFFWFGIITFIVCLLVTIAILKKALNFQKSMFGFLISLGTKPSKIGTVVSLSYFTIIIIPLLIGYGFSFLMQYVLASQTSSIMFFPNGLIIFSCWPLLLILIIIPIITMITLTIVATRFLNEPPLKLINEYNIGKTKKVTKLKKDGAIIKNYNLKITKSFFLANLKQLLSTSLIFLFSSFFVIVFFNLIISLNYSMNLNSKVYQPQINSLIQSPNSSKQDLYASLKNKTSFNDSANNQEKWISQHEFNVGTINNVYIEADLFYIITGQNLYNHYLSSFTVKTIVNDDTSMNYIKTANKSLFDLLVYSKQIWVQTNHWPIISFGFKIYDENNDFLINAFNGKWEFETQNLANQFNVFGFMNNSFNKWLYYKNIADNDSLKAFDTINNNCINVILPMQMAKILHANIGSVYNASIKDDQLINQPWNKLPLQVVGINQYWYWDNTVIVNQASLYNYLVSNNKDLSIIISNGNHLADGALSISKQPQIEHNIGIYSPTKNYYKFSSMQLIGDYQQYFMTSMPNSTGQMKYVISLLTIVQNITLFYVVIAIIILFIIIMIIFEENKPTIIILKTVGYSNRIISSYFITPYLISFLLSLIINSVISFFVIQIILTLLFNLSNMLILFSFSILIPILVILITFALISMIYLLGYKYIAKQSITLSLNET